MILLLITTILIIILSGNFVIYWVIFLKTKRKRSKAWDNYTKVYLFLFAAPLIIIPVITSSFFEPFFGTVSYFKQWWPGFLLIGIILIIVSIKFGTLAMKQNKIRGLAKGKQKLITTGVYEIMRHPMYFAWVLFFIGLAFIFDSLIALIITPFFILFLGFEGFLEERFLLEPQFGNAYEKYKEKTPDRLFPPPYDALFIIIAILVVYLGLINFNIIYANL